MCAVFIDNWWKFYQLKADWILKIFTRYVFASIIVEHLWRLTITNWNQITLNLSLSFCFCLVIERARFEYIFRWNEVISNEFLIHGDSEGFLFVIFFVYISINDLTNLKSKEFNSFDSAPKSFKHEDLFIWWSNIGSYPIF